MRIVLYGVLFLVEVLQFWLVLIGKRDFLGHVGSRQNPAFLIQYNRRRTPGLDLAVKISARENHRPCRFIYVAQSY